METQSFSYITCESSEKKQCITIITWKIDICHYFERIICTSENNYNRYQIKMWWNRSWAIVKTTIDISNHSSLHQAFCLSCCTNACQKIMVLLYVDLLNISQISVSLFNKFCIHSRAKKGVQLHCLYFFMVKYIKIYWREKRRGEMWFQWWYSWKTEDCYNSFVYRSF